MTESQQNSINALILQAQWFNRFFERQANRIMNEKVANDIY